MLTIANTTSRKLFFLMATVSLINFSGAFAADKAPDTLSSPSLASPGINSAKPQMSLAQTIADTPETREMAAKEYLKVQPVEQLYQDTVNDLAVQVPEARRQEFLKVMGEAVDMKQLNALAVQSLTENFTASELNYMTDFYGSPTGQAIYQKFPAYLTDIGQGLRQIITLPEKVPGTPNEASPSVAPSKKP